jgi:hypothetical protein
MANFNNQFATQKLRQEMSVTGTGATFTPGTGEQTAPRATKKVVRKKLTPEEKDVEPKLAAGKAKVYMKDKWDWQDAPSVPNRPSKGGFIYKQLFEDTLEERFVNENLEPGDRIKVVYGNEFYGETGTIDDIVRGFVTVEMDSDGRIYSMHSSDVKKIEDEEDEEEDDEYKSDYSKYRKDPDYYEKDYKDKGTSDYFQRRSLDESYSKFKTETKTRGKSDQFHQAVREVRKKVQEINRLFEYVNRLKSELSEGEGGLKYKMHTEKALAKIKEMVSELNQNIKRFK